MYSLQAGLHIHWRDKAKRIKVVGGDVTRLFIRLWFVCVFLLTAGCNELPLDQTQIAVSVDEYDVVIRRDVRGVPHILGATDVDVAFGFAYAQAEDNWALIEASMPFYRGDSGLYNGIDGAVTDYLVRWLGLWETLDQRYETDLAPATRAYLEAFAAGLNFYAVKHPEEVDERILPITGQDVVAGHMLRHLLFYGFDGVVGELNKPTRQRQIAQARRAVAGGPLSERLFAGLPIGSNAFAVAPSLSTDGATRIAINSHQPTTGPVAWYEAHLTSEAGLQVMGGLFPGSPFINVGFTPTTAWGATVNKPDLVDVYVLEMHPENPYQYKLDGVWTDLERSEVDLKVRLWGFFPWTVTRDILASAHGPVMQTDHGTYAVRYAGMGELRQVEQWYAMNQARSLSAWRAAMSMMSFASFNFVYADHTGNILFVHNSKTPRRSAGYDWTQYLPGDRSALIWQDTLTFDELPQVVNPPSGFVFSANQTPFRVSGEADNPSRAAFSAAMGFQEDMTNRAHRGLELMQALAPISEQDFYDIKHDKRYSRRTDYVQYLDVIAATSFAQPLLQEAQTLLAGWDLNTDLANPAAALGTCVFLAAEKDAQRLQHPPDEVVQLLQGCVETLMKHHGRVDPPWGEVNRHVRGDINLPVAGGPDTLRAIYGQRLDDDPFLTNVAGDGLYYLVSWDAKGQQTVAGVHQFGSATLDATSSHYADQAEGYVNEVLHDAPFTESALKEVLQRVYRPGSE